jgi:hypothetical protein
MNYVSHICILATGAVIMMNQTTKADEAIITIAKTELVRWELDLPAYVARVTVDGEMFIVVFRDRDLPAGARGVVTKHPTLVVEINARDKKILRSYFAR